ncbi:MAG: hypothetical protein HXY42_00625 [Chloroflexi bacterium]|nr:hypothetical protein [Chloroflexota bacterium]
MKRYKIIPSLMLALALLLQACNMPRSAADRTPTPDALLAAQLTITALSGPYTATPALPTFTAPPAFTPTPVFTPTLAFTPTPSFPYVTLSQATNCRVGPAVEFVLVDTFQPGQTIEVVGRHPFDNYWFVRSPNNPNVTCWLWGFYATGANLGNVPVLAPPPTYTPAPQPSFDAAYVNSGKCLSWWTRIFLKNTGALAFKSISIAITDTVTSETRAASLDGFQDVNACILTAVTPTLGPGETYTVVAPSLSADPTGHKVSATVKLCTEIGQGGACTSKTIEFTP